MEFSNFFTVIQVKVPLQRVVHYFGVFYDPTVIASACSGFSIARDNFNHDKFEINGPFDFYSHY